jgi:Chaperone of endosialidase/Head domain of trimeric autotransporter adhesin
MFRSVAAFTLAVSAWASSPSPALAQSLGTFRWQTQPYCNVLTLTVMQQGGLYKLDGFDDQCGAATKAPVSGTAVANADGTIQFGLTVVESPTGQVTHLSVPIAIATLGGNWTDGRSSGGTFRFTPAAGTGGPRRPVSAEAYTFFGSGIELSRVGGRSVVGLATNGRGGFDLSNDQGLVLRSNLTLNVPTSIPDTGPGRKMLWYPSRAAFRAGRVNDTQWDDAFIGDASVAFGANTTARGAYSVAIGDRTLAGGQASVAIGELLDAAGDGSVALGYNAGTTVAGRGSFVFGDGTSNTFLQSLSPNQFLARATGGTKFYSSNSLLSGVMLAPNASAWSTVSDANTKENFRDLDGGVVLAKLAAMPIREWNYKVQDTAIRHVGPTAQDFHAAFGLGEDPLRISTIDSDGIALRAIQALEERTRALMDENRRLRERLDRLERSPQ